MVTKDLGSSGTVGLEDAVGLGNADGPQGTVANQVLAKAGRPPWYRRRSWVVAGLVLVVVAVAVITDLPRRNTPRFRREDLAGFISGLGSEVAQCNAGLHDAIVAYEEATSPHPKVPTSTAASFVQDGIAACSFTNAGVVALGSQQAPRTLLTLGVGHLPSQVGLWAALDAFSALQDLKVIVAHPSDAAARSKYRAQVVALDRRRSVIEQMVARAQTLAGTKRASFPLTEVRGFTIVAARG